MTPAVSKLNGHQLWGSKQWGMRKLIWRVGRRGRVARVRVADFDLEGLARAFCACARRFIACVLGCALFRNGVFTRLEVFR